jgi:hypothetical protein
MKDYYQTKNKQYIKEYQGLGYRSKAGLAIVIVVLTMALIKYLIQ